MWDAGRLKPLIESSPLSDESVLTNLPVEPTWHVPILAERLARLDSGDESVSCWEDAKIRLKTAALKQTQA
jgi:hypothetical protein